MSVGSLPAHWSRQPRGAAFFDLDNTLIKGSALFHLGSGMVRHRMITRREITRHAWHHLSYRWRGERADHVLGMRDRTLELAAGLPVAEIVALSEQVFDERLATRIWDGTRRLADQHLEAGEPVWVVTAAPAELAELVARRLGFTGALGTRAEVRDGVWTGRLAGDLLHHQAKADAVRELAGRDGLLLDRSGAYSDSINDLPLLETVAQPHAVNPDRRLREIASRRGWPVHDFRAVAGRPIGVPRRTRLARSC